MQWLIGVFFVAIVAGELIVASSGSENIKSILEIEREREERNRVGPRVVNGVEANAGQFPYVVHIEIEEVTLKVLTADLTTKPYATCCGSIIAPRSVLTAAHCTAKEKFNLLELNLVRVTYNYIIRGGSVDANAFSVKRETTVAVPHEDYADDGSFENDIALIIVNVNDPFIFDSTLQLIALPPTDQLYNGAVITIMGFGYISDSGPVSDKLMTADLIKIDQSVCARSYRNGIPTSCFCAESVESDEKLKSAICSGDSGCPAVVTLEDGEEVVVGVASFGSSNGCITAPQGFMNVILFVEWIQVRMM